MRRGTFRRIAVKLVRFDCTPIVKKRWNMEGKLAGQDFSQQGLLLAAPCRSTDIPGKEPFSRRGGLIKERVIVPGAGRRKLY